MQKICKMCSKNFEVAEEDLNFYEKMKAPAPNYCPECRVARRLCFRNERTLYKRTCSKSGKPIISLYPKNTPFPVYDQHIWWGDDWDALDYGQDYDSNKHFFEQFLELKNKVPRISLLNITSVNSDYGNNVENSKNCYLIFAAQKNEDCMYGRLLYRNRFVVDSDFVQDSELCYGCIDCRKCYQCLFSENCETSTDLYFCFNLRDCQNCIFSTNLRHKNYHIFNKPVSKEEYENKKKEIFSSHSALKKAKEEFEKFKKEAIVKFAHQVKCNKAIGDYMYNCHNTLYAFDSEHSKNCKYIYDAESPIDSYDLNNTYYNPELNLDMMGTLKTYNAKHSVYAIYCSDIEYCDSINNSDSCFGCIGLKKKKYCILNKQYEKEEYEKLKEKITENMKKEGVYGDFFPSSISPFGYNETLAQEYIPMTEKEAKEKGFNWQNQMTGTYGKETIKGKDMPETIEEVSEDPPAPDQAGGRAGILKEILVCEDCKKNFRITKSEFDFYKRMNIPLPHKDFECRHKERMLKRNPRKLWHRKCMKEGCKNEFETSYSPDRPEIIYCETCYQQEVY
ncbi:MAG: hypothetical protein AAB913_00815 [Patescibacteria group bacterium]